MVRKMAVLGILGAIAAQSSGCASIVARGPDTVIVNSNPDGARVSLDNYEVGTTPCTVVMKRDSEGILSFERAGYRKKIVDVDKVLNGWFLGNLIFGGALGIVVDLVTHNQGKYPESPISVDLEPEGGQ